MTDQPIGANVRYTWDTDTFSGYVSFGEYDEENNCSQPDGLNDDYIFYYCSHKELVDMIGVQQPDGWTITSIEAYSYGTYEGMSTYGEE